MEGMGSDVSKAVAAPPSSLSATWTPAASAALAWKPARLTQDDDAGRAEPSAPGPPLPWGVQPGRRRAPGSHRAGCGPPPRPRRDPGAR